MRLQFRDGLISLSLPCLFIQVLLADRLSTREIDTESTLDNSSEGISPIIPKFPITSLGPNSWNENGLISSPPGPSTPTLTPDSSDKNGLLLSNPNPSLTTELNTSSLSPTVTTLPFTANSAMNGNTIPPANSTAGEYKPIPDALPIAPRVSAGLAISGIIMVLSGTAYTMIGIRKKWLQTYLSSCYLASLAATALIIYVMKPTVSQGIQAAYVVAVTFSGLIWGALSLVFTEFAEGLGCLLGGFCLSMWLLTLKPGGLLNGIGKILLITALSLGGLAFFLIKYIRLYSQMIFISFAGATTVVLGIDCFSRAGLKEFWLYIWNLNPDIFPPNTSSYPVTRGIKVEISSILFITLLGVISQKTLGKFPLKNLDSKKDDGSQITKKKEDEEDAISPQIEKHIADERRQWEEKYGCKDEDIPHPDQHEAQVNGQPGISLSGSQEYLKEHEFETETNPRIVLTACSVQSDKESQANRYSSFSPFLDSNLREFDTSESPNDIISSASTCGTLGEAIHEDQSQQMDISSSNCESFNHSNISIDCEESNDPADTPQQNIVNNISTSLGKEDKIHSPVTQTPSPTQTSSSVLESGKNKNHTRLKSLKIYPESNTGTFTTPSSVDDEENIKTPPISKDDCQDLQDNSYLASINESITHSDDYASEIFPEITEKATPRKPLEHRASMKDTINKSVPDNISKVFVSYRTKEWAKHLRYAETPDVDELKLGDNSEESNADIREKPVPVNVLELQQTAESCLSQISLQSSKQYNITNYANRRNSKSNHQATLVGPEELHQNNQLGLSIDCNNFTPVNNSRSYLMDGGRGNVPTSPVFQSSKRASCSTLIGQRDSIIRKKSLLRQTSNLMIRELNASQVPREFREARNSFTQAGPIIDEENMTLSQRRSIILQSSPNRRSVYSVNGGNISSMAALETNQSRLRNISPDAEIREQQLASWRASVQENLLANTTTFDPIEQKQTILHGNKEKERMKRHAAERQTLTMNGKVDEMMRSGEMMEAHREALRRLQQKANQNIS